MVTNLLMIAVFIAIFYFLIWRPQSKRAKEHRSLIESLGVGSEVVFAGGLMVVSPKSKVIMRWLN